jgi:hypothetical protein
MSVVNSIFTALRAIRHGRPPVKTVLHMDDGPSTTYAFRSIMPSPFCSPWRHPIWWWKLRHLRHDIRVLNEVNPETSLVATELNRRLDDAFINGAGD